MLKGKVLRHLFSRFQSARKAILEEKNFAKAFRQLRLDPQYLKLRRTDLVVIKDLEDVLEHLASAPQGTSEEQSYRQLLIKFIEGSHDSSINLKYQLTKDNTAIYLLDEEKILMLSRQDFRYISTTTSKGRLAALHNILTRHIDIIPHSCYNFLLVLCKHQTPYLKEFKSAMLSKALEHKQIVRFGYNQLVQIYPQETDTFTDIYMELVQNGRANKHSFLEIMSKLNSLSNKGFQVVQKLISEGGLDNAWMPVLRMNQSNKFYFSAENKKEVFQFIDNNPHLVDLPLVFFLKNDVNDEHIEWSKLYDRFSSLQSRLSRIIKTMLKLMDIKRFSEKVREEVLMLLWLVIEKQVTRNDRLSITTISEALDIYIKDHLEDLNTLSIPVVKFDHKYDQFARRRFFPKLTVKTPLSREKKESVLQDAKDTEGQPKAAMKTPLRREKKEGVLQDTPKDTEGQPKVAMKTPLRRKKKEGVLQDTPKDTEGQPKVAMKTPLRRKKKESVLQDTPKAAMKTPLRREKKESVLQDAPKAAMKTPLRREKKESVLQDAPKAAMKTPLRREKKESVLQDAAKDTEGHRKTIEQCTAEPKDYLLAALSINSQQRLSQTEMNIVASYMMNNIHKFSISNISSAYTLFHTIKFHLPQNFMEVLQARAAIVLQTQPLTANGSFQFLRVFGVKAFDSETLLKFEEKIIQNIHHFSEQKVACILSYYDKYQMVSSSLAEACTDYLLRKCAEGTLGSLSSSLFSAVKKYPINKQSYYNKLVANLERNKDKLGGMSYNALIKEVMDLVEELMIELPTQFLNSLPLPGDDDRSESSIYRIFCGVKEPTPEALVTISKSYSFIGQSNIYIQKYIKEHLSSLPLKDLVTIAYTTPVPRMPFKVCDFKPKNIREFYCAFLMLQHSKDRDKDQIEKSFSQVRFPFCEPELTVTQIHLVANSLQRLTAVQKRIFEQSIVLAFSNKRELLFGLITHYKNHWSQEFIESVTNRLQKNTL